MKDQIREAEKELGESGRGKESAEKKSRIQGNDWYKIMVELIGRQNVKVEYSLAIGVGTSDDLIDLTTSEQQYETPKKSSASAFVVAPSTSSSSASSSSSSPSSSSSSPSSSSGPQDTSTKKRSTKSDLLAGSMTSTFREGLQSLKEMHESSMRNETKLLEALRDISHPEPSGLRSEVSELKSKYSALTEEITAVKDAVKRSEEKMDKTLAAVLALAANFRSSSAASSSASSSSSSSSSSHPQH